MLKCPVCGKDFVKRNGRQRFCSSDCQTKDENSKRRLNRVKTCVVCGKEFTVASGQQVVCSKECKRIHANALAREAAKRKAVHRFVKCLGCGKVFQGVGAYYRYCPVCRVERRKSEDTKMGLTYDERRAIAYAQDRLTQEELYQASQTWTPKQHKYALARWRMIHGM